jgi:hypothetical protein
LVKPVRVESEQLVNIEAWAGTAAASTVVVGALGALVQKIYRVVRTLEDRSKELKPNGGSSMNDTLAHVSSSVDTIGDQLRAVSIDVLGIHARLDRVETRQTEHERDQVHR